MLFKFVTQRDQKHGREKKLFLQNKLCEYVKKYNEGKTRKQRKPVFYVFHNQTKQNIFLPI